MMVKQSTKLRKSHLILSLLLGVVITGLVFTLANKDGKSAIKLLYESDISSETTGFADYNWIPNELKHEMDHLVQLNPDRDYYFYYYFKTDDINRHYYLDDSKIRIVSEMPVTNEEALERIDDKLLEIETRKRGRFIARDTTKYYHSGPNASPERKRHQLFVVYILPEEAPDFRQLRISIVESTKNEHVNNAKLFGKEIYELNEVDIPPQPVRGFNYFRAAVHRNAQLDQVLALFDTGTVTVEFAVNGTQAQVLGVVRGLEDWSDSYEAYQADSEFMKAVHHAKVWWKPGLIDDQPVNTKMRITFKIDSMKVSSVIHQSPSI